MYVNLRRDCDMAGPAVNDPFRVKYQLPGLGWAVLTRRVEHSCGTPGLRPVERRPMPLWWNELGVEYHSGS